MIVLIMGVVGSEKTTIGSLLAAELGWIFIDADDFHNTQNIEKMTSGIPLMKVDRAPWLRESNTQLTIEDSSNLDVLIARSALTKSSRNALMKDIKKSHIVDLQGDYELIHGRICSRDGHFFKENNFMSQYLANEKPEDSFAISIELSPEEIGLNIIQEFGIN